MQEAYIAANQIVVIDKCTEERTERSGSKGQLLHGQLTAEVYLLL